MTRFKLHLITFTILLTFLLTNALLLTHALTFTPTSLIHDKLLAGEHSQMLKFILTGRPGNLVQVLTPSEFSHIQDVQKIYMYLPFLVPLLIAITFVILKHKTREEKVQLIQFAQIDLIILMVLSIPFFTIFFEYFHKLLFPQGNWAFPVDSTLIRLYPEDFWKTCLTIIIATTFIETGLLVQLLKRAKKSATLPLPQSM